MEEQQQPQQQQSQPEHQQKQRQKQKAQRKEKQKETGNRRNGFISSLVVIGKVSSQTSKQTCAMR
jgi:FtsZ-interacting cell division protein YlmF